MIGLRFPAEAGAGGSDYVTFTPMQYRSNASRGKGIARAPAAAGAKTITLYMPNNTPNIANGNSWGREDFQGPMGAAKRDIGSALVTGVMEMGGGSGISGIMEKASKQLNAGAHIANAGNIGKQAALQAMGQEILGGTPNQILALSRGQVYNPNVELLYQSPNFRQFNFNFDFVPKNRRDAQTMNEIILNFKKWSAPKDLENGMFEVPYVWQVTYHTGSGENQFMNKFKPAACMNVSVVANQGTDMHVGHDDGAPVQTSIGLLFKETDIILRDDHTTGQGY